MDDEGDLLDVGLDTSPSFDVLEANSSVPQHPNATATTNQKANRNKNPKWLQGGSGALSQRDIIQAQMAAKSEELGDGSRPVVIHGDSFGNEEDDYDRRPSIKDRVRKTAVAAVGSTIVASGTVMLITPAHPFGHAVQAAGLGVLATEFEGPKKTLEKSKARASFIAKKLMGTSSSSSLGSEKKSDPLPTGPSPLQDTSDLQRSLASKDYVSPFRKDSVPPNATQDPKEKTKEKKKVVKEPAPKPVLHRQGSTSLSSCEGMPAFTKKEAKARAKAAKANNPPPPIPKPTLNRQGSTSLSGGI